MSAILWVDAATPKETVLYQKLAGIHGSFTSLNARYAGQENAEPGLLGIEEYIAKSQLFGGGLLINHINLTALENTPEALEYYDLLRKIWR